MPTHELLRINNRKGLTMKAVLVNPDQTPSESLAFVYTAGLVLGAVAVHRLGLDIAYTLAEKGYRVLLFDATCTGESEGEFARGSSRELSAWVEAGALLDDTLDAISFLKQRIGVAQIAFIGHCGGALTAAYATSAHQHVHGALLLSLPTILVGERWMLDRKMAVDGDVRLYVSKLKNVAAWKRLLSGKSDYKLLLPLVRKKLKNKLDSLVQRGRAALGVPDPDSKSPVEHKFNPLLVEAVRSALEHKKLVSVVFGDHDPEVDDCRQFHQKFPSMQFVVLKETSHGFITEASQRLLREQVVAFSSSMDART